MIGRGSFSDQKGNHPVVYKAGHAFPRPYGALEVPDQGGVPVSTTTATDQAALAAYEGTYRLGSFSSRDMQEPRGFGGLGIEIKMDNGLVKVVSPIQDAPAAEAGIMPGDIITQLDDVATEGMTLDQVREKMRGPVNTTIRLRLIRKGQEAPTELTIARAVIRPLGAGADLQVAVKDGKLQIEANGALPVLDFAKGAPVTLLAMSSKEFFVDGGGHTRVAFLPDEVGKATRMVLNPGPWQIMGQRVN